MPDGTIRVVIADDHPLLREGLVRSLTIPSDIEVVGQGGSAEEALRLAAAHAPEVMLLDIGMPGGGLEAARRLRKDHPDTQVAILTASERPADVIEALRSGVKGYLVKGIAVTELLSALRVVAAGGSYVSPNLAAAVMGEMQRDASGARSEKGEAVRLSVREEQILRLLAEGSSNKEIGARLKLQEKTVKHYMTSVMQKLQVRNRTEAALYAKEHMT